MTCPCRWGGGRAGRRPTARPRREHGSCGTRRQAGSKGPKKVKEWKSPDEGQGRLAAIMLSPTFLVLLLVIGLPILAGHPAVLLHDRRSRRERLRRSRATSSSASRTTRRSSTGPTADRFWNAFYVTTFFTVVCVVIEVVIGVGDGADHEPRVQGPQPDPGQHPRPVGHPDRGLGRALEVDLQRQRRRQRRARQADPVVHRRHPGPDGRDHRGHLEDRAVHRPAGPRRPPGHPRGGLRGRQDRRLERLELRSCTSRCRW